MALDTPYESLSSIVKDQLYSATTPTTLSLSLSLSLSGFVTPVELLYDVRAILSLLYLRCHSKQLWCFNLPQQSFESPRIRTREQQI